MTLSEVWRWLDGRPTRRWGHGFSRLETVFVSLWKTFWQLIIQESVVKRYRQEKGGSPCNSRSPMTEWRLSRAKHQITRPVTSDGSRETTKNFTKDLLSKNLQTLNSEQNVFYIYDGDLNLFCIITYFGGTPPLSYWDRRRVLVTKQWTGR